MKECPAFFTTGLRESGSEIHGHRYQDVSVLIATVLDRRRDLFAVHKPTLILDSTMVENSCRIITH